MSETNLLSAAKRSVPGNASTLLTKRCVFLGRFLLQVNPGGPVNPNMVNSFLKKMPKNVLMSMIGKYMTKTTQDYLDKNPIGI